MLYLRCSVLLQSASLLMEGATTKRKLCCAPGSAACRGTLAAGSSWPAGQGESTCALAWLGRSRLAARALTVTLVANSRSLVHKILAVRRVTRRMERLMQAVQARFRDLGTASIGCVFQVHEGGRLAICNDVSGLHARCQESACTCVGREASPGCRTMSAWK